MVVERKGVERGKKVTYLGYKFKRSGEQEGYVRERVKKAMGMIGTGMGNWEEKIRRRLEEKNGVV